jgi:mono/diheme cytochrome c family protein
MCSVLPIAELAPAALVMNPFAMNASAVRIASLSLICCLAALVAGCTKSDHPQFHANAVAIVKADLKADQQQDIANVLHAMFGTPDDPYVLSDTGLDLKKIQVAAGPVRSDEFGRETGLYRRHCGHCHGTTGDGLGPTALILNPYPRDYRQGKFKFKATERPAKPTDADLDLVVRHGVQGTAMPAFGLLPDAQIRALVEYVKYLSIRGEMEIRLIDAVADLSEGEKLPIARSNLVDEILKPISESWTAASESIIQPPEKPAGELAASIAKGQEIFYGTKGNCAKCHGPSALGDGQTSDYDDWNKPIVELTKDLSGEETRLRTDRELTSEERATLSAHVSAVSAALASDSLPPRTAVPRNLRQGVYRGGRRPLDVYRRIYAGINGMPMPAVGPASPGAKGTLEPDEIWNLVDYVMSLPYEPISQPPRQRRTPLTQAKF